MTGVELKEKIIAYSKEIGIDKIGFASTDPFLTLKDRLIEQQRLQYQSGFEEPDIEKRTEPERLLPEAKTIISIALAYPSKMKNEPKSRKGDRRGLFCRASWGQDYHNVLKDRLQKLEDYIADIAPEARNQSMVDTGELSDRAVAERAGIGWSGKNCAIITPEFGSYVYLGEMITTLSLEPDKEITDQCGTCNKCVDACPTGALVQGGQLDSSKCIAFLTQTKGSLPERFRKKIGNRIYGCDTCQTVCPENKGMDHHQNEEFEPDPEVVKPRLEPLLTISNREFKEVYGPMAGSWRGKKPIQRNAVLALGTYKAEEALDSLTHVLHRDPRPVIRGSAAWSLGQIGTEEALQALYEAEQHETDESVQEEIANAKAPHFVP
ncbi:tRNA epoxyqueuosine(34) reductase QueG [Salibacterium halotolerans]|uniref:Epoxyqueuosine reductase n=1 Tax=Salibacterium halotolerans TaxID=1884432 RepID=A0A1I5UK48_9BACI|nr:tRNA epoxyqueuosine(34) reductase QueG [Salibacterium halotolerans]SFP95608.1 epoxyqueuosine reductase [Salibacterium halotolerans]